MQRPKNPQRLKNPSEQEMSHGQIALAKAELSQCEGCNGHCQKAIPYYRTLFDGKNYRVERCEYYKEFTPSPKKNNADLTTKLQEYLQQHKNIRVPKTEKRQPTTVELALQKKKAGIPARYIGKTFSDYEKTPDNAEVLEIAHWYLEDAPNCSLYLYGGVGTGKTFLASIMAQELIRQGKRIVFGDVPSLLDRIKATFDGAGNAQDVLDSYFHCDLLILDDFGAGHITDWNVGIMYQIINQRYADKKPVIITSNLDVDGLQNRLAGKDALTAKRIASRINEMCEVAFFGLKDRRK